MGVVEGYSTPGERSQAQVVQGHGASGTLPFTGTDVVASASAGVVLIVLGLVVARAARKKPRRANTGG